VISAPVLATRLLAARKVRRLLGCGCLAAVSVVALPVFMLFAAVSGLIPGLGDGAGSSQVDAGTAGLALGGQPLAPGGFTISQGFGCTGVMTEPPPPRGYTCPPNATHPAFVRFHTGIDLAAATGLPVLAVAAGTVHVLDSRGGFGVHILLAEVPAMSPPVVYLYGHLSGVAVPDGDVVRPGEPIGFVGSTGNSTGPHLHFEVDVGGVPVNPCSMFAPGYLVPAGVAAAGCLAWAM
jgi:murein DD-endopeptidase MepM/ murein hydrolase activator NlpD